VRGSPLPDRYRLDGTTAARQLFSDCFAWGDPTRESLWVAHVDERADCLYLESFDGDASNVDFPLAKIMEAVIECRSKGLVLAHNHPSGDPSPSDSDRRATQHLATVAQPLGCSVLDHLIFGGSEWTSFRELGLL